MFKTWNAARRQVALTFVLALCLLRIAPAAINYGTFTPLSVSYIDVTESSGTDPEPLFGPPQGYPIGLDFDPIGFASYAQGGAADTTAGQLHFTLSNTHSNVRISGINFFETGDYTLTGSGTAASSVLAAATINATVTHINGLPVVPILLPPVNASVGDSLPGSVTAQPWFLSLDLDFEYQLAGLGYGPSDFATSIDITINNTLTTGSEASSAAFIAKKDVRIDAAIVLFIPEPGSLLLGAAACCFLALRRR